MFDKTVLKNFLEELKIEKSHSDVIFNTLDSIEANDKARELFLSFYSPYKEKGELDYQALIKEALPKLWELPKMHKYEINLAVLFSLAPFAEPFYLQKGFSHKIFIDSILDLKWKLLDCIDINGFAGIRSSSLPWFERWFFGSRYAFHRLQFEINKATSSYKSERFDIKEGDPVISIHIPSARNGIKFNKENRDISYRQAKAYYSRLLGKENPVFSCNSWLLAPYHSDILPESSNIRQFKEEFEIASTGVSSWHLPLIFNTEVLPELKDLPESSSMQRAYKKFMLEGGVPGSALGYRYFED